MYSIFFVLLIILKSLQEKNLDQYQQNCIMIFCKFKYTQILQFISMKNTNTNNGKNNQKKAGRYKLTKGLNIKLSPFASLYRVFNLDTRQVWHAKVIDNQIVNQYGLYQSLEFNIQFLLNAKDCENVIYVEEMFQKAGNTFIIQQQYDKTLVQTVMYEHPLSSGTIEDVLRDVLTGILEIYKLGYLTRSLRPEHIVSVDDVWKIQSFVLNSQMYAIESQYCWSSKFASPEDRSKNQELPDRLIDEQLVWNIGILGLYMVLGPDFSYEQINKDSYIPWDKVKENVGQSLYRFLVKSLKVDFKDRMRLSQMYENQMFKDINTSQIHPFQSYSKFYSDASDKISKVQHVNLSNENLKKIQLLRNDIQRFKYYSEVDKYVQELPYKNIFDLNLVRYLSFKICFENIQKIKNQVLIWKRQQPILKNYQPLKDIQEDLNMFSNKIKQNKINYYKNIKGTELTKSEVTQIKACFLKEIVDEKIPYAEVIDLYMKSAGSIYTLLVKECERAENQSKSRTICFYSLGAYLIHFYDPQKFENLNTYYKNGVLSLSKLINQAPVKILVSQTQKLVKENFSTVNSI